MYNKKIFPSLGHCEGETVPSCYFGLRCKVADNSILQVDYIGKPVIPRKSNVNARAYRVRHFRSRETTMNPFRPPEMNWIGNSSTAPRPIASIPVPVSSSTQWAAYSATFPVSTASTQNRGPDYDAPIDMTSWAPEYSRSFGEQGTQFQSSFEEKALPTMSAQTQPVDLHFASSPGVSPKELFLFHNFPNQYGSSVHTEDSAFDDCMETDELEEDFLQPKGSSASWNRVNPLLSPPEVTHFEMETDTFDDDDDSDEHSDTSRVQLDEDELSINLRDNPFSEGTIIITSHVGCF